MPQILKHLFAPAADPSAPHEEKKCSLPHEPQPDASDKGAAMRLLRVVEEADRKLQEARDKWRMRWERDAVKLACRIAQRCLRDLPFDSASLASQLVDESLRGVNLNGTCEIRLNPDDYRQLAAQNQWSAKDVLVLPDVAVEPGGCVVKTPNGVIDQSLSAQIARVEQELTDI